MERLSRFRKIIKTKNSKKNKGLNKAKSADYLGLKRIENNYGEYFYKKYEYEENLPKHFKNIGYLDKLLFDKNIYLKNLLFFDLETTSLSIGAGTYPFLIGIGYFKNQNTFIIEQYLFSEISSEKALINIINQKMKNKILVTYNGKCFDIPLIKNRFILNNKNFTAQSYSIDLLYIMRRLFKYKLSKFDLQTVSNYLNVKRSDIEDVEGYEIPNIFKDYMHMGKYKMIEPVLYHNERDVYSLAVMIKYIEKKYKDIYNNKKILAGLLNYEFKSKNYNRIKDINFKNYLNHSNIDYKILKIKFKYLKKKKKWLKAEKLLKSALNIYKNNLYFIKELTKIYYLRLKDYNKTVKITKKGRRVASKYGLKEQKKYFKKIHNRYLKKIN